MAPNTSSYLVPFQSTLPCGSDLDYDDLCSDSRYFNPRSLAGATRLTHLSYTSLDDFNPRSLAGATSGKNTCIYIYNISIHAPSRERHHSRCQRCIWAHFNPRSLTGATRDVIGELTPTAISIHAPSRERPFWFNRAKMTRKISIHAPSRERLHQNKLLLYSFKSSIFCELAQLKYSKIYFDVRKLIVSHSSLSCEPKLNFMFHITSHHEPKLHKR